MKSIRRRCAAIAMATCAVAVAAPVSGASAAPVFPTPAWSALPLPAGAFPAGGAVFVGGNQIGNAGCVGTNRPSYGGNSASTSAQNCGAPGYQGAQIGAIQSLVGPVVTNTVGFVPINTSNASITY
jgi:hypothetical protein